MLRNSLCRRNEEKSLLNAAAPLQPRFMGLRAIQTAAQVDAGGGLEQAVTKLCVALVKQGVYAKLLLVEPVQTVLPQGLEAQAYPRSSWLKTLGISKPFKDALRQEAVSGADVIHSHSLWRMTAIYPASSVEGTKCRFIFSPHGTLAPWMMNHRKWRKEIVWTLMQKRALKKAHAFHATSEKEVAEIRRFFKQPIAVVPDAVDIPELKPRPKTNVALRRLLFLGRMHAVKAVEALLESWQRLQRRFPEWELVAAGGDDGDGYLEKMRALAKQLKLERLSFPGLIEASERDALYQSAELYVLPSRTENFGISVAEALANGLPAVVTKNAPWKNLEREGCGWWTGTQPEVLAECLAGAMSLPAATLSAMGARGRAWMAREFSWELVAQRMARTYEWLSAGGAAPEWVC